MPATLPIFVDSAGCTKRTTCHRCRNTANFGHRTRRFLGQLFTLPPGGPDFDCPHGIPWDVALDDPRIVKPALHVEPPPIHHPSPADIQRARLARLDRYRQLWSQIHRWMLANFNLSRFGDWLQTDIRRQLPCSSCITDFDRHIELSPPDVSSAPALFRWTVALHNRIRAKQGKPQISLAKAARIHGCTVLLSADELAADATPVKLLISIGLSLGDEFALTAPIADLLASFPGEYEISLDCRFPDVFAGLAVSTTPAEDPDIVWKVANDYEPGKSLIQFMHGRLSRAIGRPLGLHEFRPVVSVSEVERHAPPLVRGPFILIMPGGKYDCTAKIWPAAFWQRLVKRLRENHRAVQIVAVGGAGEEHIEAHLQGVIDLVGQTTIGQLVALAHDPNCLMAISGITSLVHLAAAARKPAIVIAGARENRWVAQYPDHVWLETPAPCGACWALRATPLGPDKPFASHDTSLCRRPDGEHASCMTAIRSSDVADAVARLLHWRRPPTFAPVTGISVGMITHGQRPHITEPAIRAARLAMRQSPVPVELIVCGNVDTRAGDVAVDAAAEAQAGLLGAMRNQARDAARFDAFVSIDDDIFLDPDFFARLVAFSDRVGWDVLGVTVRQAEGWTLRWRAADADPYDPRYVQTGGFVAVRTALPQRWDPTIPFYADRTGGINEDVEFSRRLLAQGYALSFDGSNTVWHWDSRVTPAEFWPEFAALLVEEIK